MFLNEFFFLVYFIILIAVFLFFFFKSECDKLRSVLTVKTTTTPELELKTIDEIENVVIPKNKSKSSDELRAELQTQANMVGQQSNMAKKQGVSAEPDIYHTDKIKLIHHKKSAE